MRFAARLWRPASPALLTGLFMVALTFGTFAQQPSDPQQPTGVQPPSTTPPAAPTAAPAGPPPNPNAAVTSADHKNMMEQLGIKALRPGPSGNESAPNHANYDESTANPYPNLPEVLTLKNGKRVTSADMWWKHQPHRVVRGRWASSARQGTDRRGGQFGAPGHHRRDPDDRRDAGERHQASAGDDDVRRSIRHAAGARNATATRARIRTRTWRPWSGSSWSRTSSTTRPAGHRAVDRGRMGVRHDQSRQHTG